MYLNANLFILEYWSWWDFPWNICRYKLLWCIVELYMLLCIPVIHGQTRRRHHWRKLSTGDQLDKLDELPWPPPANLICIFSFSGTADQYYVTICLCWFVGNKISIYLSIWRIMKLNLVNNLLWDIINWWHLNIWWVALHTLHYRQYKNKDTMGQGISRQGYSHISRQISHFHH